MHRDKIAGPSSFPSLTQCRLFCGVSAVLSLLAFFIASAAAEPILWWELEGTERYLFRQDDTGGRWKNWRAERQERKEAHGNAKRLILRCTDASSRGCNGEGETRRHVSDTRVWARDPLGVVSEVVPVQEAGNLAVSVPRDLNLNGRHIVVSQTTEVLGERHVCVCAKTCIVHMRNGGTMAKGAGTFFDDPEKVPLEIGSILRSDTNPYAGVVQTEHTGQSFQIRYRGKPLTGAPLRVTTESGWVREYTTGEDGVCTVIPIEDRGDGKNWQRYRYETTYDDRTTGDLYRATLTTIVCDYRHKWRSMLLGVTVLSVLTAGLVVCAGIALFYYGRKKRASLPVVVRNRSVMRGGGDQ
jgi:hypothetical protein